MISLPPYQPDPRFDPDWRDDVLEPVTLHIPLILPDETPRSQSIWVHHAWKSVEDAFHQPYNLDKPRRVTMILKPSEMRKFYRSTDESGNEIPQDHPMMDIIFPPKAWMTDSLSERSMMLHNAKQARGRVLVGGLGLAIYPQFVFMMQKPVEHITIVEMSEEVIRITGDNWLSKMPADQRAKVTIVQDSIEHYLQTTDEIFDTIFLDTWDDADSRFLPHVNYLVQLSLAKCAADGRVGCWEYGVMVKGFVRDALMWVDKEFPLHDFRLDPGLQRLADWLADQQATGNKPTTEEISEVARQIAITTIASQETYERHLCLTAYAQSHAEFHTMLARTRKQESEDSNVA